MATEEAIEAWARGRRAAELAAGEGVRIIPPVPFRNGQRVTSDDERLNYATAKLAAKFWRGGGDEDFHFLLYLCGETVRTVQAATDEYDARQEADR